MAYIHVHVYVYSEKIKIVLSKNFLNMAKNGAIQNLIPIKDSF